MAKWFKYRSMGFLQVGATSIDKVSLLQYEVSESSLFGRGMAVCTCDCDSFRTIIQCSSCGEKVRVVEEAAR